jgi:hypothetical protein
MPITFLWGVHACYLFYSCLRTHYHLFGSHAPYYFLFDMVFYDFVILCLGLHTLPFSLMLTRPQFALVFIHPQFHLFGLSPAVLFGITTRRSFPLPLWK